MAQHDTLAILENRKRTSFHLDSSSFVRRSDDQSSLDSAASSPSSSSRSPTTPFAHPPNCAPSPESSMDRVREPALGPQRTRSVSSSSKGDKEKRKRSRVAPEQLIHLERFFAADRSPTAARRREISELLAMQERQTQIWFQNRRAKAKVQDGKQKGRGGSAEIPPDTPPELSTGFEVDLHNLIHEDEPVTIIPCTDLSIGTWRRIATTVGKHDLVAYICDVKRCLTWFIHSAGYGFKMEIPFDIIVNTEFTNAAPGSGLASFLLSQPPTFFLEEIPSPPALRHWKRCADWTEGNQASKVLRHNLIGSAVQLAHVLRNLHARSTRSTDIPLQSPSYKAGAESPTTMEVPQPPMVGLSGPGFHYQDDTHVSRQGDHIHGHKGSCSGLIMMPHSPGINESCFTTVSDESRRLQSSTPTGFHSLSYSQSRQFQPSPVYALPIFSNYTEHGQHPLSNSSLGDYSSISIPHGLGTRPYSAHRAPRTVYGDETGSVAYHGDGLRRHSSATLSQQYGNSPSPPLLTTPYHPPLRHVTHKESSSSSTPPLISGLPASLYGSDDELTHQNDRS